MTSIFIYLLVCYNTLMDIETIILSLSYFGIFLLMTTNGALSFPSSQALYIICGYFVFTGDLNVLWVMLIGALGNTLGNVILYELTRRKGIEYIMKFQLFPMTEVKKIQAVFKHKGPWFLFVGKLLPAIKVFVPIAAGIGKTPRVLYAILMYIASFIWTIPFLAIGFYFGKSSDLFGKYAIVLMVIAFVVLAGFYKYMNSEKILKEIDD